MNGIDVKMPAFLSKIVGRDASLKEFSVTGERDRCLEMSRCNAFGNCQRVIMLYHELLDRRNILCVIQSIWMVFMFS